MKFTRHGNVTFRIEACALNPEDVSEEKHPQQLPVVKLPFSITDTGPGIPADMQAMIFHAFEQVGDPLTKGDGAGLGLSINVHIVRLMGGELHVESALGQGSRFWFEIALPAMQVTSSVERPPLLPVSAGDPEQPLERLPSQDQLQALRHAAMPGDILDIRAQLQAMQQRDPALPPFVDHLRQLNDTYRIDLLQQKLDNYRTIAQQSEPNAPDRFHQERMLRDALIMMPAQWRQRFQWAVAAADYDMVLTCIEEIRSEHPALAGKLNELAYDYRFDVLDAMLSTPSA